MWGELAPPTAPQERLCHGQASTKEVAVGVLDALPDGITGIDTYMGGSSEITAGFLLAGQRPALIETGPAKVAGAVASGVAEAGLDPADLAWIVVTHIHLDHAGGVGDLVRTFPNATVVVHPAGARHLVDPERLLASSARVYGPLMETVYGGLTPVEAARIKAAEDEEVIDLGGRRLELLHAPGHAKHHLAVFEPDLGALFAGDGVGVLLPSTGVLRPATPPPDFDRDLAVASLHRFAERNPAHLVLTHFGPITPPADRLAEAEDKLLRWCETAERAAQEHGAELDHIAAALRDRFEQEEGHRALDPERFELLNSYESNAAGLLRWIQQRQRRDEAS
jgi:glyoxylase-like metal-dependent hydrolase (beta-lactamase superfamily II)